VVAEDEGSADGEGDVDVARWVGRTVPVTGAAGDDAPSAWADSGETRAPDVASPIITTNPTERRTTHPQQLEPTSRAGSPKLGVQTTTPSPRCAAEPGEAAGEVSCYARAGTSWRPPDQPTTGRGGRSPP
jgi:hypothetical protein